MYMFTLLTHSLLSLSIYFRYSIPLNYRFKYNEGKCNVLSTFGLYFERNENRSTFTDPFLNIKSRLTSVEISNKFSVTNLALLHCIDRLFHFLEAYIVLLFQSDRIRFLTTSVRKWWQLGMVCLWRLLPTGFELSRNFPNWSSHPEYKKRW